MNRSDLTARIPEFIDIAEARMRRDVRLRQLQVLDFTASEEYTLPSTFKALIDMYYDGTTHFGAVNIVSPSEIGNRKRLHGDKGIPAYVAVVDGPSSGSQHYLRFAPEPSGTYTLRMTYEANLDALTDSNTTNWLLAAAPDLYLWATLSVAEGYLQEDERVGLWKQEYEQAALEFKHNAQHREYGGRLTIMPTTIMGEI